MAIASRTAVALSFSLAMLPSCTVVPAHDGMAQVRADHVVARVKCDLATVILEKAKEKRPDGSTPYAFLFDWAAKLHFTVIVDDQASLNPGATVLHALHPAGTVAQTFSLGVGAGVTTQAVRQEDYEYLMSFRDLRTNNPTQDPLYNYCQLPEGLLLESNIGLAPLVNAALKPIESNVLYPGNNYGPGALPPVGTNLQPLNAKTQLEQLKPSATKKGLNGFFTTRIFENDEDQQAKDIETRAQAIVNNIIKPLYGVASTTIDAKCLGDITFDQQKATVSSVNLSGDVIKVYQEGDTTKKKTAVTVVENDFKDLVNFTNSMIKAYKKCAMAEPPPGKPKLYDPIDAIAETVNFYVTATGSITPSWKLVTVTAPLAPTFASATRRDTNTLILSLGRPVIASDGSPKASDTMNNQILASLLSQAIAQRPIQ